MFLKTCHGTINTVLNCAFNFTVVIQFSSPNKGKKFNILPESKINQFYYFFNGLTKFKVVII